MTLNFKAALIPLLLLSLTSEISIQKASAQDKPKTKATAVTTSELEAVLSQVRRVYARPLSRKILNDAFAPFLIEGQKEVTETQLIHLMYEHPVGRDVIELYLEKVDAVEANHLERIEKVVATYANKFHLDAEGWDKERLMIRASRGQTYISAITKYLKKNNVSDAEIDEATNALKETNLLLDADLVPVKKEYTDKLKEFLNDPAVVAEFKKYADPLKPLQLRNKDGNPGYEVESVFANHPYQNYQGEWVPISDLENEGYLSTIHRAESEIAGNVFETSLRSIGAAIKEKAKNLKEILWGFDKGTYDANPDVQANYQDMLDAGQNVIPTLVVTSNLDHSKIVAIDYKQTGKGYVYVTTGNATPSCSGKFGDLFKLVPVPKESRPNANIGVLFKSDILASIFAHDVKKSVDPRMLFKGADFPIGGLISVKGEGEMIPFFTPNGANGNVNKNVFVPIIDALDSPHMGGSYFVISSDEISDAVINWGLRLYAKGITPQPKFTFHIRFAMQRWSSTLKMVGLKLIGTKEENNLGYIDDPDSLLVKTLTKEQLAEWRKGFQIESKMFQDGVVTVDGEKYPYTVKDHEKLAYFGDPKDWKKLKVIFGSINPSNNALKNQEYGVLAIGDRKISELASGVVAYMYQTASLSVIEEAIRRNIARSFDDELDPNVERPLEVGGAKEKMGMQMQKGSSTFLAEEDRGTDSLFVEARSECSVALSGLPDL